MTAFRLISLFCNHQSARYNDIKITTLVKANSAHLLVILVDVAVSKLFPTQFTFVRFVLAVDDLVRRHLVQALERATADLTGIWSLL